jgi:hypothetical protein
MKYLLTVLLISLALLTPKIVVAQECYTPLAAVEQRATDLKLSVEVVSGDLLKAFNIVADNVLEVETDTVYIQHDTKIAYVVEVSRDCVVYISHPISYDYVRGLIVKAKILLKNGGQ